MVVETSIWIHGRYRKWKMELMRVDPDAVSKIKDKQEKGIDVCLLILKSGTSFRNSGFKI